MYIYNLWYLRKKNSNQPKTKWWFKVNYEAVGSFKWNAEHVLLDNSIKLFFMTFDLELVFFSNKYENMIKNPYPINYEEKLCSKLIIKMIFFSFYTNYFKTSLPNSKCLTFSANWLTEEKNNEQNNKPQWKKKEFSTSKDHLIIPKLLSPTINVETLELFIDITYPRIRYRCRYCIFTSFIHFFSLQAVV